MTTTKHLFQNVYKYNVPIPYESELLLHLYYLMYKFIEYKTNPNREELSVRQVVAKFDCIGLIMKS